MLTFKVNPSVIIGQNAAAVCLVQTLSPPRIESEPVPPGALVPFIYWVYFGLIEATFYRSDVCLDS